MPLPLWRIVKAKHVTGALDGEGARRYGGRWNPRGTPVVYLGGTLSLAALETFMHLAPEDARLALVAIEVVVPDSVKITELATKALPADWRNEPPPHATQAIGLDWVKRNETALLRVPSIIVPREFNYLLNPNHRDFAKLKIQPPVPFGFDSRMWK
ncbi:MAG: RES family NAD+ phosphorylase [Rhodocyclales bacterium]|nr:RES family NAD+ phosphorylase [Rhodocyclales bacterium]